MHKADTNAGRIIAALQRAGCTVEAIQGVEHRWGHRPGVPDLLVCNPKGVLYLLEVKAPGKHATDHQIHWMQRWGGPVHVVHDEREALTVVGILRAEAA